MGDLALAKSRIRILALVFTIVLALLSLQLFRVQIFEAANYKLRAVDEMETTRTVQAPRGDITDVNGVAFARSVSAISIVVDQTQINNPAKTAAFVAPILGLSVADVQASITGTRKYSMVLKNGRPALWEKLTAAMDQYNSALGSKELDKRIIGFFPERSYIREYPSGQLISSLVGFVRADGVGATGLESSMNSVISGTAGRYSYARANGAEIPGSQNEIIAPKAGTSVRLTIDRDVQWIAAKAIAFGEILSDEFMVYAKQVQKNAQTMAAAFVAKGYEIISGGTDNHLMLIDLRNKNISGKKAEQVLGMADITANKNMVPYDDKSAFVTSGIRFGVAAITSRGMNESHIPFVVDAIDTALMNADNETVLANTKKEVNKFMEQFVLYPELG